MPAAEIRPIPPVSLERLQIPGAAGAIECDLNDPGAMRRGVALIAHPHPLQGGTKDNKVVTTLAKAFYALGYVTVRPNFRGVGTSAGVYDEGRGETEDMLTIAAYLRQRYSEPSFILAGFSFGSFVQARVAQRMDSERVVLVGAAVNRFSTDAVPAGTLIIHGENDEVVPLKAVLDWVRPQQLPVVVVPGGEHFFHGRLPLLAQIVAHYCR
jgi:alpha/beta superfamily hydrolase